MTGFTVSVTKVCCLWLLAMTLKSLNNAECFKTTYLCIKKAGLQLSGGGGKAEEQDLLSGAKQTSGRQGKGPLVAGPLRVPEPSLLLSPMGCRLGTLTTPGRGAPGLQCSLGWVLTLPAQAPLLRELGLRCSGCPRSVSPSAGTWLSAQL